MAIRSSTARRPIRVTALVAAMGLVVACSAGGDAADTTSSSVAESSTTTTTAEATTTTPTPAESTTEQATTTTAADPEPADEFTSICVGEYHTLSYPAGWFADDATAADFCTALDPEPFELPEEGTDERVAAVTVYVDAVPFAEATAPDDSIDGTRAATVVAGHQAVRVDGEVTDGELFGPGTPITRWAVDLSLGADDGPGTLFVELVDHPELRTTVDRMVRTLEFQLDAEPADPAIVARYEGGGAPFAVLAEPSDEGLCLVVEPAEARGCADPPTPDDPVRLVELGDGVQPILAGLVDPSTFRVDLLTADDGTVSVLPVLAGEGVAVWAAPVDRADVTAVARFDTDGAEIGSTELETPSDDGPDAVGEPSTDATDVGADLAAGETAYLTEIRFSAQDGFDRLVFEFADGVPSARIEAVAEILQVSGEPVTLDGDIVLIRITPASRVDLTGSVPDERYTGPTRLTPSGGVVVRDIVLAEDFEANLVWGVGVEPGAGWSAAILTEPTRLVVDFAPTD